MMMKYGLMLSLIVSSTIFAGEPQEREQQRASNAQKSELVQQEKELKAAKTLLCKHKGHNVAALEASWDELEKIDDICDDIEDQLQGRDHN
jgi:hypothetical protein